MATRVIFFAKLLPMSRNSHVRPHLSMFERLRFTWIVCALLAVSEARAQVASSPPSAFYRRSRTFDLTGSNPRDSVVLVATGKRADSLAIVMTFHVGGVVVHRQRWTSEDELYDVDSLEGNPAKLAAFMRPRLDEVLASVKRQLIDPELVKHMGDEAVLRAIKPRPTHHIMYSFAFETSTFLAWDPVKRKMVVFMECC